MTRERPVSVLILGLLNLLAGGLCLFAGVAKTGRGLLLLALPPGQRETISWGGMDEGNVPIPDLETYLELEIPSYSRWEVGVVLSVLLAGIVLLAMGRGLLHMRPWVRWLAVLYALGMLAWQMAYVHFQVGQVLPVAEVYFLDESWRSPFSYMMPESMGLARTSFVFFVVAPAVLLLGHAAIMLLVLVLPSVRAAFREPAIANSAETHAEPAASSV